MALIMVDVEADGPCPGLYSMIEIGAMVVDREMDKTFYGKLAPLDTAGSQLAALNAIGKTIAEIEQYPDPKKTMMGFDTWLKTINTNNNRLSFISDNNGFDWQFVNYYFWKFIERNPFGHSSNNLANTFGGLNHELRESFKHLRKTKHTHHPIDDCRGNVEALLAMVDNYDLMGLDNW